MSSAFEDAARYAGVWDGMDLVAYEPIALPLWATTLEVVVQKRKPIHPIEEFVLRTVAAGLDSIESVSGLLGLEAALAQDAVLNQLQAGHLTSEVGTEGERRLVVTGRGQAALADLAAYVPERQETYVIFDRILRSVTGADDRGLLRPRDLRYRALRARPPVSSPRLADIPLEQVVEALAASAGKHRAKRSAEAEFQVIGIKRVARSERRYRQATLLVYSNGQGKFAAGVVDGGRKALQHNTAISKLDALKFLEIDERVLSERRPLRAAMEALPTRLRGQLVDSTATRPLVDELWRARKRLTDPDILEPDVRTKDASPRDAAMRAFTEAGRRLEAIPVRPVVPWEHCLLLEWAILTARQRIVIASSALTSEATSYDLCKWLDDAASRGVAVDLWLPPVTRGDVSDGDARRRLHDVAQRRSRLQIRETTERSTLLAWDGNVILGTFPWLGHIGDPSRGLINHESVAVNDSEETERGIASLK